MNQPASTTGVTSNTAVNATMISDSDKLNILNRVIAQVGGGQYPADGQAGGQMVDQVGAQVSDSARSQLGRQVVVDPEAPVKPSVVDQVIPGVALQATDTLNPAVPVRTGQERVGGGSVDSAVLEVGGGVNSTSVEVDSSGGQLEVVGGGGIVETEKVPEMPVEVESYLQHVEDHHDQLPQEVVITGDDIALQPSHRPTNPVVVLPITEEDEKKAKHKNTSYSIRWLVEWSHKLIKRFAGKIIYRVETEKQ